MAADSAFHVRYYRNSLYIFTQVDHLVLADASML